VCGAIFGEGAGAIVDVDGTIGTGPEDETTGVGSTDGTGSDNCVEVAITESLKPAHGGETTCSDGTKGPWSAVAETDRGAA
jgi:hypothetical protein